MTPKEAKELIEQCGLNLENTTNAECENVIFSALEKQIPKKPIKIEETYIVERDEWEVDYECPSCGNPYADNSYCSCCGQALDWSDTE